MANLRNSDYYCHPLYATHMSGYGVDINAPRMPYVTSTILVKRPLAWLWRPVYAFLQMLVERMLDLGDPAGQGMPASAGQAGGASFVVEETVQRWGGFEEDELI